MTAALDAVIAIGLSLGVLCLLRWLPLPIQGLVLVDPSPEKSRFDYLLGTIGTTSYFTQIIHLIIVGFEFPTHASPIVIGIAVGAIAIALLLFGVGVLNFMRAILSPTPRSTWQPPSPKAPTPPR